MNEQASAKRGPQAYLALLVCIAAPFAWISTMGVPWMRSSGIVAWMLLALGVALGWSAMRTDKRRRTRWLFGLDVAALAFFAFAFFGLTRLPAAERALGLAQAGDFTLLDEQDRRITLHEELTRGPVLLVFYRGHW